MAHQNELPTTLITQHQKTLPLFKGLWSAQLNGINRQNISMKTFLSEKSKPRKARGSW